MSSIKAQEFIKRHGMDPILSDPAELAVKMCEDMEGNEKRLREASRAIKNWDGIFRIIKD